MVAARPPRGLRVSSAATLAPAPGRDTWAPDTVAGVQDVIRSAVATRTPLRIVGRGTWLDGGHPTAADARPLRIDALAGVIDYTPGDLTLTARAGTTLSEIEAVVSAHSQWLPLDPPTVAEHGGTIGATVATASAGSLSHALGLPRDIVLGLEVVTGDGAVVRGGGRVVKNVAGFDLTRLMTGAWGTLGVITEVTVRLRGRPVHDETVVLARRRTRGTRAHAVTADRGVEELVKAMRLAPVTPLAAELLNPRLAAYLELPDAGDGPVAVIRLGGNTERVRGERAMLEGIGDVVTASDDVWTRLRRAELLVGVRGASPAFDGGTAGTAVLRWSQLPAYVANTWAHAHSACAAFPDALLHASLGRGIVRAVIPHCEPAPRAAAIAEEAGWARRDSASGWESATRPGQDVFAGTCVAERLPAWLWGAAGGDAMRDRLSRRVRRAFDPIHVLNRGILGEGPVDVADHD